MNSKQSNEIDKQPSEINQQPDSDLAEPFSQIFVDRAEADWAFDLLREATRRLRVTDPYDPRVAIIVSTRSGKPFLHLNFGNWLVLGFRAPGSIPIRVDMALLADRVSWDERFTSFASDRKEGEPEVRSYELPIETVRPLTSHLQQAFEATLDFIADKFASWKRSPHWKLHNPEIIESLFDPEKREQLFATGLTEPELRYERHLTAFHLEAAEEEGVYEENTSTVEPIENGLPQEMFRKGLDMETENGYFTTKTFELLAGLHLNPTKDYYMTHRDDFKTYVEQPFQQLFYDVANQLPKQITDLMETEKRLFARILKNDYGRGGAWDFYWGAFYPKGGKRTEDAQLSMWINQERFEFGFYIGDYGIDIRKRFLQNCQDNYGVLKSLLGDFLSSESVVYGSNKDFEIDENGSMTSKSNLTWEDWLKNPEQGNYDIKIILPKHRVLQRSAKELTGQITRTFIDIFPLVLLALSDEPMPLISEYVGYSDEEDETELNQDYPLSRLADDTGFDEDTLSRWVRAIERKGQAILYGPPGTGKTFIAEGLAQHLIGGSDGFWELVQFHPAYAYEDFMQGLRPKTRSEGGLDYRMVPGRFLEFCQKAQRYDGRSILIIDEINRANLARVFGELMYLLEYRNREVPLAGGGSLKIPDNVRLIGTMNTADRSIALVDHALRRRFAFITLRPNYQVLRSYHRRLGTGFPVERLIKLLTRLNGQIEADYQVGITFFLSQNLADEVEDIWRMEIEPYLEEYFFDQQTTVDDYRWDKIKQEILSK